MRYRAALPATCPRVELDAFLAMYHRPSGMTHLLASPAPELLAALGNEALDEDELLSRLSAAYEIGDPQSLVARLDELVAAGLVEAV